MWYWTKNILTWLLWYIYWKRKPLSSVSITYVFYYKVNSAAGLSPGHHTVKYAEKNNEEEKTTTGKSKFAIDKAKEDDLEAR